MIDTYLTWHMVEVCFSSDTGDFRKGETDPSTHWTGGWVGNREKKILPHP
jgi:hypothetical protein